MKKIFIFSAAILLASAMYAQKPKAGKTTKPASIENLDRSIRPVPGPAPTVKLGNIQSFQLPNGMKVFVVENHKTPTVAYSIVFDIQPPLEGDAAGTAEITSQLITSGTRMRSKDQLDAEIDFIGATLTATPTSLYASSLKKQERKLLELMSDVLINSNFRPDELEKIKTQTLSGLAQEKDDPDAISKNVQSVLNFGKNHPYGENVTEESVAKVTLEGCTNYYKSFFRPNVAYMAVVGDVNFEEVKMLVNRNFGTWRGYNVPTATFPTPAAPSKTRVAVVNKPGAVQSVVNVTYPVDLKPDNEDVIKARVLNTVLGAGFSSRLFINLREKHGYTYGSYSTLRNDILAGEFSAYAKVRNAVTDSSIEQIMFELNRIRTEKVPQDELEGIKNYLSGNFAIGLEDPEVVANYAINIERYKLPKDYYTNYLKNLSAVTVDDVYAMAQKYIRPENATILVVGDKDEVSKKVERFSATKTVELYDNYGNPAIANTMKPIPAGITPGSVTDAYVKAIGGEKALTAIKDLRMKMTTQIQGRAVDMEIEHKTPNKYAMSFAMGAMVLQKQTYDGVKGKESGVQGKKELTGDELDDLKAEAVLNPEMQYEKLGYKLNLKGIESLNGNDAYVLDLVSPSGKKSTEWYDVKTGLKVKNTSTTTGPEGTMTQVSELSDYKDFNGIKYPGTVSITGTPMPIKLTLESVEVNKGIKDSDFSGD